MAFAAIMGLCSLTSCNDFLDAESKSNVDVDVYYSRAYLHHLFKAQELLALEIASIHNLAFYLWLVKEARKHILAGDYSLWKSGMIRKVSNRL